MTPEQLEAHRVRFEQAYAASRRSHGFGPLSPDATYMETLKSWREDDGYGEARDRLNTAWQAYQWAIADAQHAAPVSEAGTLVMTERERCAKLCDMRWRALEAARAHADGTLQGADPKYWGPLLDVVADLAKKIRAATPQDFRATETVSQPVEVQPVAEIWQPMETAPKDGTLIRLLVDFEDHATEDGEGPHPTIGSNTWDNHHDFDEWLFAGWSWTQDFYTQGVGTPVGWLPMLAKSAQPVALQPVADYEEALEDQRRLVRELDVLLNGSGAAEQASLCDIVSQLKKAAQPKPPTTSRALAVQNALVAYEEAFEKMFAQCCSNPVMDTWGRQVDMTQINLAHHQAQAALGTPKGHPL